MSDYLSNPDVIRIALRDYNRLSDDQRKTVVFVRLVQWTCNNFRIRRQLDEKLEERILQLLTRFSDDTLEHGNHVAMEYVSLWMMQLFPVARSEDLLFGMLDIGEIITNDGLRFPSVKVFEAGARMLGQFQRDVGRYHGEGTENYLLDIIRRIADNVNRSRNIRFSEIFRLHVRFQHE